MARVMVVPYDPGWPERAATLVARLRADLGPPALRIDHIGSTAVPGMPAKDVIDLQVSVSDLEAAARAFDAPLEALGLKRRPYERDHARAGLPDDPLRWAKRFWAGTAHPGGAVNLHVRVAGSPNERLALLFRDWLRAHPEAVPAYGAFKTALAAAVRDADAYTVIKDPVVDVVIVAAESWAAATGWTPASS